jgi:Zn finger protein HypA/HybF involved in hydrogenase expression
MHEMSVAMEICRIAEEHLGLHSLGRVREIGLVVGRDSGVEPDNLAFCLDALLDRPPFGGARTSIELTGGDELKVSYLEIDDDGPPN